MWQKTLNFSEASIQGPQGWDLLVSWVIERIKTKKLKGKQREGHQHYEAELINLAPDSIIDGSQADELREQRQSHRINSV